MSKTTEQCIGEIETEPRSPKSALYQTVGYRKQREIGQVRHQIGKERLRCWMKSGCTDIYFQKGCQGDRNEGLLDSLLHLGATKVELPDKGPTALTCFTWAFFLWWVQRELREQHPLGKQTSLLSWVA